MERISKHISYSEAIHSDTAKKHNIDNTPNGLHLVNMCYIAKNVFEPLREHFKVPIFISSMFRSLALNKALKGAKNSQHMANNGAAMDLDADRYGNITNTQIFNYIKDNLEFDQLIAELEQNGQPRWIHVSYNEGKNRKQVLIAYKDKFGRIRYKDYTKEEYNKIYNGKKK